MFKFDKTAKRNLILSLVVVLGLIAIDQWVKALAVSGLRGAPSYSYLNGFVVIEYAENRGAFLSLGAGLSDEARLWVFVVGVIFILAFCAYSLLKSLDDFWTSMAFSLVITGGIGNLIDRIAQGYVVDYIHMGFSGIRTGVFNVADVAISAGLLLLIFLQYKRGDESGKGANGSPSR